MKTIATHSGKFHADDVFAVATLQLILGVGEVKVVRTRDEDELSKADYVVDVGYVYNPEQRRFDHHQPEGAGTRENGIPYASFGLVWKQYGSALTEDEELTQTLDEKLVQPIDAIDSGVDLCRPLLEGVYPYDVGMVIDTFLPSWKEKEVNALDEAFRDACSFAADLLSREVRRLQDAEEGYALTRRAYDASEDRRIIVLEVFHPWSAVLTAHPEPVYVVYPMYERDRWAVWTVGKDEHTFERRKLLPEHWRGKTDGELQDATGIRDAIFVHRDGFIGGAASKDGAVALAKKALEYNNT